MTALDPKAQTKTKLLLLAREFEQQGFFEFTILVTEKDGGRWKVTDTDRTAPMVEYLGDK